MKNTPKRSFIDFLTGTSRVDNYANPGSALNMMLRKQKNTAPPSKQPKSGAVY